MAIDQAIKLLDGLTEQENERMLTEVMALCHIDQIARVIKNTLSKDNAGVLIRTLRSDETADDMRIVLASNDRETKLDLIKTVIKSSPLELVIQAMKDSGYETMLSVEAKSQPQQRQQKEIA